MTEKFVVTGMTCAACAAHVEKAANSLDGVDSAAVNLMLGTLVCSYDADKVTPRTRPNATSAESRRRPPEPWAAGFCGPWCVWCPCSISAWVT